MTVWRWLWFGLDMLWCFCEKQLKLELKVWWHDATLLVYFSYFITYIYSFIRSHSYIHTSPFAGASLHFFIACKLSGKNHPVVPSRESNSGLPYSKPTRYQLSNAAPYWVTPHHSEQRRTILSNAAPCWATPHHTEQRRTIVSNAAPYWATPHHAEQRRTITEQRRTILSNAAPYWATPLEFIVGGGGVLFFVGDSKRFFLLIPSVDESNVETAP